MTAQIVSFAVSMGVGFILSPYLAKAIDISASVFVTQGNQFVSYAQILVSALNTMASRFITVSNHHRARKRKPTGISPRCSSAMCLWRPSLPFRPRFSSCLWIRS